MKRAILSLLLASALLAGCGGPPNYAQNATFAPDARYRRDFAAAAADLCDAARRVLLGDGYVVSRSDELSLLGGKEFQSDDKQQAVLNLYVNCERRGAGSTLFVTATEEHFDVKAIRQSSSIGFPVIAPIYYSTLSEAEQPLKIRGETVSERGFYERFYAAVQRELAPAR